MIQIVVYKPRAITNFYNSTNSASVLPLSSTTFISLDDISSLACVGPMGVIHFSTIHNEQVRVVAQLN